MASSQKPDFSSIPPSTSSSVKNIFSDQIPTSSYQVSPAQKKVRQFVEHIGVRTFIMFLIIADVVILIFDLANSSDVNKELEYITIAISTVFLIEVFLRMYGLGLSAYFGSWLNIFDLIIVVLSFTVAIVVIAVASSLVTYGKLLVILRFIRLPRLLNLFRMIFTQRRYLVMSSRKMVSENKQRYQDDSFDLDLCYITENVIAMSFPSSGIMALYRNPIGEVGRFLDEKHPCSYKVYNMCSERTYDVSYFHGRVERVMIDDHNPPRLRDMIRFAASTREWFAHSPDNVIVVHCKGGKGRTGTLICTHLVDAGVYESAQESLEYFGDKRTDHTVGKKFQGVETPSQSRYVGYFEIVKNKFNYQLPPTRHVVVTQLVIRGLQTFGNKDGSDIWFEMFAETDKVFEGDMKDHKNLRVISDPEDANTPGIVRVGFINSPTVSGDVKFRFFSRNKSVPAGYEKCACFFWFYTSFIKDNKLILKREDLDNPHKPKTWKKAFGPEFAIELYFEDSNPINGAS